MEKTWVTFKDVEDFKEFLVALALYEKHREEEGDE